MVVNIVMPTVKEMIDRGFQNPAGGTGDLTSIGESLKNISNFLDYLLHPSKILMAIWDMTVSVSYVVCLFVCIGCVLLYILGHKKQAKWIPTSIGIYALLQAIGSAFR